MERIIISDINFEKIRRRVLENSSKNVIFSSDDDDLSRRVLEKLKINMLLISQKNRKDFMKQRNSGLNSVLVKIAKKNGIDVGIDFDEIVEASADKLSFIFGRVRQNIVLCSKAKVKMRFVCLNKKNERNIYDIKSLGLVLGMPTWMTKGL